MGEVAPKSAKNIIDKINKPFKYYFAYVFCKRCKGDPQSRKKSVKNIFGPKTLFKPFLVYS